MNKHLIYIVSLFIVVIAAGQTAIADSVTVELAEKTPPADLGDPILSAPPPPTTTTTTTLPIVPRCPDKVTGSEAGAISGPELGYDYWAFDDQAVCNDMGMGGRVKIYCFENPWVDVSRSDRVDWEDIMDDFGDPYWTMGNAIWFGYSIAEVTQAAVKHPETCFICACFRVEGCFAPGVKITMADGSLRNIEDVRAGDSVRNARSGAAVKVRRVIEGPEAAPLIRFGFEGTTVTTSQAHPVLTAAGLKPANELKRGDLIFDGQGHPHTLTILETLPLEEGQRVINLDLDVASSDGDERLMVSDGIVTGDLVLQGLLQQPK